MIVTCLRKTASAFALVVLTSTAQAGGLFAPLSMDSTATLPKGVRNIRLGGFSTEMSDKYSGSGSLQPLGSSFNKPVTWKDLTDTQPAGFERGQFRGGLQALGVNMNDVAGDSRGAVNALVTTTLPVAAYGVTDRLTVGLAVPIVRSSMSLSTGWGANAEFQATVERLSKSGFYNKVLANEAKLQNVVATKVAAFGYKPLESETRTEMGDITLAAKYQAYKDKNVVFAVSPKIVVPTGRVADVDKLVDVAPGDGQWDAGVAAIAEFPRSAALTLSTSAGYVHQFASQKAKRIPTSADDSLTADVDPSVREKLGDILNAAMGARYKVEDLWTFAASYGFQYKARDTYQSGRYAAERYEYLSVDTEQNMHTATVGLSFSTIPLYAAKEFAAPLEASINYSTVLTGRNVNRMGLTSLDLAMYF